MEDILSALEETAKRLYSEKKFKEVEDMFSTFIKESQEQSSNIRARAFNDRGHAKYMQVEFPAASLDYDLAIELDSSLAVAFYNRGMVKYRMGEFSVALTDFDIALGMEPENQDFKDAQAQCKEEIK